MKQIERDVFFNGENLIINNLSISWKLMLKYISILFFVLLFGAVAFSQTDENAVPVKWERYKVSDKEVSVLLPKLPILIRGGHNCSEKETRIFAAYAEEVVYNFTITSKSREQTSKFCNKTEKFEEVSFENRVNEIKQNYGEVKQTVIEINAREVVELKGRFYQHWLFNDYKNKRWFELQVAHRGDLEPQTKDFIESLKIEKNPSGIEIGDGSNLTLGDFIEKPKGSVTGSVIPGNTVSPNENNQSSKNNEAFSITIVHKPRANYTESARQNLVKGTVTLRVLFQANGGIGQVIPVSGLPEGLTEEAIKAAKKIVFIPAKKNGVTVSVAKLVQYSFAIY